MEFDNVARQAFYEVFKQVNDEYRLCETSGSGQYHYLGLLGILDLVNDYPHMKDRDDCEELAFYIFRIYNKVNLPVDMRSELDDLPKLSCVKALRDLLMSAFYREDERHKLSEGNRGPLSDDDYERLTEVAINIFGNNEGIFEGPETSRYDIYSAIFNISYEHNSVEERRDAALVLSILVGFGKTGGNTATIWHECHDSNRRWNLHKGPILLETALDDTDREVRERVRDILEAILPSPANQEWHLRIRSKIAEEYYGPRTDHELTQNNPRMNTYWGPLLSWIKEAPSHYP